MATVPGLLTNTAAELGQRHGDTNPADELVVSFQTPLPSSLHQAMGRFIEQHPQWDQYGRRQPALAGFLLQHGVQERQLTRRYISSMFGRRG